jgi:glyoxylase-like metal-dependent hydrolase (beta-lactamase superfamily II)
MLDAPVLEGSRARVRAIDAGSLWLDGGAMFGVVPKPLWSRRAPPDERNRIPLAMRCLLVESDGRTVLVDTGLGNKENEKFHDIYGVSNAGAPTRLEDSLAHLGIGPEDIDLVVSTHLHFDHAGGNTVRDSDGEVGPAFPHARYVISRGEYEFARRDNERIRASYMARNFQPLVDAGRVDFAAADTEPVPGIQLLHTPGHTPHHQSVRIDLGGDAVVFLADLVPTRAHLPLPWVMGYDIEPLVTLDSKRSVLGRAAEQGWWLAFEHDPFVAWGRAERVEGGRSPWRLTGEVEHPLVPGAIPPGT